MSEREDLFVYDTRRAPPLSLSPPPPSPPKHTEIHMYCTVLLDLFPIRWGFHLWPYSTSISMRSVSGEEGWMDDLLTTQDPRHPYQKKYILQKRYRSFPEVVNLGLLSTHRRFSRLYYSGTSHSLVFVSFLHILLPISPLSLSITLSRSLCATLLSPAIQLSGTPLLARLLPKQVIVLFCPYTYLSKLWDRRFP